MLIGWILAFCSAAGNTGNDICKKMVMARGISPWETMALLNAFGAFLNIGYCLYTGYMPEKFDAFVFWGCFFTMLGKNLAQFTYLLSLKMAPLSSVIPYLAWNPVFLLIVGALWLGEKPRFFGIVGCLVVVLGAYLTSLDAKNKEQNKKDIAKYEPLGQATKDNQLEIMKKSDETDYTGIKRRKDSGGGYMPDINVERGRNNSGGGKGNKLEASILELKMEEKKRKDSLLVTENTPAKSETGIIGAFRSFWAFKAGIYMMITGLAWTYTSAIEKVIL